MKAVFAAVALAASVIAEDTYVPSDGPSELNPKIGCAEVPGKPEMFKFWATITYTDKLTKCPANPVVDGVPPGQNWNLVVDAACAKQTGFKAVMINWNPCGHPPLQNWGIGHFDLHAYYISEPQYKMTCGPFPTTPLCLPQNNASAPFFMPLKNNHAMMDGVLFSYDGVGVANMGMHLFVPPTVPAKDWVEPSVIQGAYAGEVVFMEAMFPLKSMMECSNYDQKVTYANQTMYYLPSSMGFKSDPWNKVATSTFMGYKICSSMSAAACRTNPNCRLRKNKCIAK